MSNRCIKHIVDGAVEERPVRCDVATERPHSPPRILFVSDRGLLGHDAILHLFALWANGRSNRRYLVDRIEDGRHELSRGSDRAAVIKGLALLFAGTRREAAESASCRYIRTAAVSSGFGDMVKDLCAMPKFELVLLSELVLFDVAEEIGGVSTILSSQMESLHGLLTGRITLLCDAAQRLRAASRFASARNVDLRDCMIVHGHHGPDRHLIDVMRNVDVKSCTEACSR